MRVEFFSTQLTTSRGKPSTMVRVTAPPEVIWPITLMPPTALTVTVEPVVVLVSPRALRPPAVPMITPKPLSPAPGAPLVLTFTKPVAVSALSMKIC